jgi:predicted glycoside hydrolase/deacetylase ChbG (UPF0249 family)
VSDTYLIVNADDFGQSPGVNRGVVTAHERGVVTSASLMVRWPAAAEAASYARANPRLSVGLHLDLGEWVFRDGEWSPLYRVVAEDDPVAVAAEVRRQLEAFRDLTGRDPSHIDSHQHAHRNEPARSVVLDAGRRVGAPVRHFSDAVRYHGGFYGQDGAGTPYPEGIGVGGLTALLTRLGPGWHELGCHPGLGDDLDTMYRAERAIEVATLCDPRVRTSLTSLGITLRSFFDVRSRLIGDRPEG